MNKLVESINAAKEGETRSLILIMGATGSGKSTFINVASRQDLAKVGHGLISYTSEVKEAIFRDGKEMVALVDTPGFNDTKLSDTDVLRLIAAYLQATYECGLKLAGVIYLYEITQDRMTGAAQKNLSMLTELVGHDNMKSVVLVTTKWESLPRGEEGESKEKQLKVGYDKNGTWVEGFWTSMIREGARVERHDGTHDSAIRIVRTLIGHETVLKIQEQVVDQGLELSKTDAGKEINKNLSGHKERMRNEQQKVWEADMEESYTYTLDKRYDEIMETLGKLERDQRALGMNRDEEMASLRDILRESKKKTEKPLADHFWDEPGLISRLLSRIIPTQSTLEKEGFC